MLGVELLEKVAHHAVRGVAGSAVPRAILNEWYNSLDAAGKSRFHRRFRAAFSGRPARDPSFEWTVDFLGRPIRLPVGPDHFGLDWELAVSLAGHDADVKATYAALLAAPGRIRVVFDVGANYGLHSFLFLAHGVRTVSFEPNPGCHAYLRRVSELNGYAYDLQAVALGAAPGIAELGFPAEETWLGTLRSDVQERIARGRALQRIQVRVDTLDAFVERSALVPQLVKLDVEGSELAVLRGAIRTLRAHRPVLVFEANEDRPQLHELLSGQGYRVVALPFEAPDTARPLALEAFETSPSTDFGAVPIR